MATLANAADSDDPLSEDSLVDGQPSEGAPGSVFVGRVAELRKGLEGLRIGHSLLIKGPPGIGKRALLREIHRQLSDERICLWPTLSTPKQFVGELAEQVHQCIGLAVPESLIPPRFRAEAKRTGRISWERIQRTILRLPVQDVIHLVIGSIEGRKDLVLFAESLEVPPSLADMLHQLAEHCQVAAGIEETNRRNKVMRLLWHFQVTLELKPMTSTTTRAMVEQRLTREPIDFETEAVREAFITRIVRESRGIPAAVDGMLVAALNERTVTRSSLHQFHHESAIVYVDMTPMILILVVALMALRYVSRGIGVQELLVLAGVGTSLFSLLLFFARRMSSQGR